MNETLSSINSIVTTYYLKNQPENQYFERKGLGEKETKPSKLAEEIIGMLNADGGILAFGISNTGEIQDLAENTIKANVNTKKKLLLILTLRT